MTVTPAIPPASPSGHAIQVERTGPTSVTPTGAHASVGKLVLMAAGVVFGDIGTSPLYAIRECVDPEHGVPPTHENLLGILSLVFWSLTMVVTVKYLTFIMKADNRGEGGILALLALAPSRKKQTSPSSSSSASSGCRSAERPASGESSAPSWSSGS
jgi:K+ transporter